MPLPYRDPGRSEENLPRWARRLMHLIGEREPAPPTAKPGDYRWWGDLALHGKLVDELFYLILGAIGSGKTTVLRALLASIVPFIRPGSNWRMLMYDPKPDSLFST